MRRKILVVALVGVWWCSLSRVLLAFPPASLVEVSKRAQLITPSCRIALGVIDFDHLRRARIEPLALDLSVSPSRIVIESESIPFKVKSLDGVTAINFLRKLTAFVSNRFLDPQQVRTFVAHLNSRFGVTQFDSLILLEASVRSARFQDRVLAEINLRTLRRVMKENYGFSEIWHTPAESALFSALSAADVAFTDSISRQAALPGRPGPRDETSPSWENSVRAMESLGDIP